jgi:hypothetical protein
MMRAVTLTDSSEDDEPEESDLLLQPFEAALMALCARFGLEQWAESSGDHGLRSFGSVVAHWLELPDPELVELNSIRLVANLLIIVGAAVRPPQRLAAGDPRRASEAVLAAHHAISSLAGPLPSIQGSAQATKRLVRVRGWTKLSRPQQVLTESMLELYLETVAALQALPSPGIGARALLASAGAWLEVLHIAALPVGFDERLLRATSWYLETFLRSRSGA